MEALSSTTKQVIPRQVIPRHTKTETKTLNPKKQNAFKLSSLPTCVSLAALKMWNNAVFRIVKYNDTRIATGTIAVHLKKRLN